MICHICHRMSLDFSVGSCGDIIIMYWLDLVGGLELFFFNKYVYIYIGFLFSWEKSSQPTHIFQRG